MLCFPRARPYLPWLSYMAKASSILLFLTAALCRLIVGQYTDRTTTSTSVNWKADDILEEHSDTLWQLNTANYNPMPWKAIVCGQCVMFLQMTSPQQSLHSKLFWNNPSLLKCSELKKIEYEKLLLSRKLISTWDSTDLVVLAQAKFWLKSREVLTKETSVSVKLCLNGGEGSDLQ